MSTFPIAAAMSASRSRAGIAIPPRGASKLRHEPVDDAAYPIVTFTAALPNPAP